VSAELFSAVASANTERVRELLCSDPASASMKDENGATPFHHAVLNGQREIVDLLLANGADINARDDQFNATPTGWAIEYLREQGGLLAIEIDDVIFAVRENDVRWVERFLTRLPALAQAHDAERKTLSQSAAESGNDEIARLFETMLDKS
jgi:ankyrin repeat protein